jgi:hypothetical protein
MRPSLATRFARHRWRRVLLAYTALALAWTAFGPLPWVILEFAPANLFAASAVDDATYDSTHDADAPHHHDGSAIPGSPTHPVDHDCFQCEVIKHLSRCILPDACTPTVPSRAVANVGVDPRIELPHAGAVAPHPPIRGPPSLFSKV